MSFSRTKCNTYFSFRYLGEKKKKRWKHESSSKFPLLNLLSLRSCSAAFKACSPLCSCKPPLHDLILNIASGFSRFQIWNSLTFHWGPPALCLFLFHWKPNSQMQEIHRSTLFCYCLKDQLQLVLRCKFHIHIFQPSKPILLKCSDSIFFELYLEGDWCSPRKSFKYTYILHCFKLILQRDVFAANHNLGFAVKFHYAWDLNQDVRHLGCKHKIAIHKYHIIIISMVFSSLGLSVLREGFRCYHCTNLNKSGRDVCGLRTLAQIEENDADHQREGIINEY